MKAYGGVNIPIHVFLSSALVGGAMDGRLGGPQNPAGRRGEQFCIFRSISSQVADRRTGRF
jgi:hypothetical protein